MTALTELVYALVEGPTSDRPQSSGPYCLWPHQVLFAQVDEYVSALEPLADRLRGEAPDANFDAKGLALFIAQLLQFMEDALGLKVGQLIVQ